MSSTDEPGTDVAEADETPPTDELRESLVAQLRDLVGDAVIEHHIVAGRDVWVRVSADAWQDVAHAVRMPMGARHFGFLSAIDWMPSPFGRSMDAEVDRVLADEPQPEPAERETGFAGGDTRFQVFARVTNVKDHWGITLKADVGDENPSIATWTKVFAGADWHEREAWEMFGIDFVGHPALRKLYLPGNFEGNPLRKDFPLVARLVKPWPGIVDVEPMPGSDEPVDGAEPGEEAT